MAKVLGVDVGRVGDLGGAVGDLGGFLREQREGAQLSIRQLAAAAGVSNPYLSQVERGLRRPSAEVLQQIARGLRISAEALYVRAGILEARPGADSEVRAALLVDPYLSERQREVVLEIYATFRSENERSAVPPAAPGSTAGGAADAGTTDAPAGAAAGAGPDGERSTGDGAADEAAGARAPRRRSPRRRSPAGADAPAEVPSEAPADDAVAEAGTPARPRRSARVRRPAPGAQPPVPPTDSPSTDSTGAHGTDAGDAGAGSAAPTPRAVVEGAAVVVPPPPSPEELASAHPGAAPTPAAPDAAGHSADGDQRPS